MKIPVIGTIFIDIKGHPLSKFIPDGRNAGRIEYVHGGVGRNIAEDLAALGEEAVFVSLVSPGGTGEDVIRHLRDAGVDTRFVKTADCGAGTWLAVYDERGDVYSSISVRADLSVLESVIAENEEEIFADADAVILEIDIDTPAVERVFAGAEKYGKPVFCAVATMSEALDKIDYLKRSELFICNQQEAGMLFEENLMEMPPEELAGLLAEKIRLYGLKNMIVTMSESGAVYAAADGSFGVCPAEKSTPVDTTGAGDSFCAGVVAALGKEMSLAEACRFGAKVAAAVVSSAKNVYTGE